LLWAPHVEENFKLISRRRAFSEQGLPIQVVVFTSGPDEKIQSSRLFFVYQQMIGFNATYTYPPVERSALAPVIDYSFNSFELER
jgi:hypothetical protein